MKKLLSIVATVMCVFTLFGLTACENKSNATGESMGTIESIGDYAETIYRYKVSKIQLIDADSESEKVLETTNRNKIIYYYSDYELLDAYVDFETLYYSSGDPVSEIANFFNDVTMQKIIAESSYSYTYRDYSVKYSAYVKMRVVLDGYDAAYRPECSINGDVMNVTSYSLCMKDFEELSFNSRYRSSSIDCLASKEVAYAEIKKDMAEYNKRVFNAEKASEREGLKMAYDEKYPDYTVVLIKNNFSVSWSGLGEEIIYAK